MNSHLFDLLHEVCRKGLTKHFLIMFQMLVEHQHLEQTSFYRHLHVAIANQLLDRWFWRNMLLKNCNVAAAQI